MRQNLLSLLTILCLFCMHSLLSAQTTLPFFEDFEDIDTPTTYLSSVNSLPGAPEWSLNITGDGRMRNHVKTAMLIDGNSSITLDGQSTNSAVTHLTLTLDLEAYQNTKLELNFSYYSNRSSSTNRSADVVEIRGDTASSWIRVLRWNILGTKPYKIKDISLRISDILSKNSQKPGKTFQVRFGIESRDSAISQKGNDGITIDNVNIKQLFNDNASVSGINYICADSTQMQTSLVNLGYNYISQANIDWWVDGKAQKSYHFTGKVNPGGIQLISFGNYIFTSGSHEIKILVDSINGKLDSVRTDTFISIVTTGLSGIYTVKAIGGDFSTLQEAIDQLEKRGACGNVVFQLSDETYQGPFTIPIVNGLDGSHQLFVRGVDSSKSILTDFDPNSATLTLQTGYVHIEHCQITSGDSLSVFLVLSITNIDAPLYFSNCYFRIKKLSLSGGSQNGMVISMLSRLEIESCYFDISKYGSMQLTVGTATNGLVLRNNIFKPFRTSAFYASGPTLVEGNSIEGPVTITSYAESTICNNILNAGLYFRSSNGATKLYNNIFHSDNSFASSITSSDEVKFYHNTVSGKYGLLLQFADKVDLMNNILYGKSGIALECISTSGKWTISVNGDTISFIQMEVRWFG